MKRRIDYGVLDQLVGYAVRKAQLAVYEDFAKTLSAWKITPARFAALVVIANNSGLKLTELARSLDVARSGAVTLVDALAAQNYVVREAVAKDARAFSLSLTREGRRALEAMSKRVLAHDRRMTRGLHESERTRLLALSKKMLLPTKARAASKTRMRPATRSQ